MAQFEPEKGELEKNRINLVFIAAEKRQGIWHPAKFFARRPVSFPFLLDEDRAVTKAYGLYHRMGMDAINVAHPATLVIDGSGTIRYVYRGEGQLDRAPLTEVIAAAQKLVTA